MGNIGGKTSVTSIEANSVAQTLQEYRRVCQIIQKQCIFGNFKTGMTTVMGSSNNIGDSEIILILFRLFKIIVNVCIRLLKTIQYFEGFKTGMTINISGDFEQRPRK